MRNKIGWCNTTWNPVWGCRNHCEYCYARKMAKRFWETIFDKEVQILGIMNNVTFFIQDKEYLKFREDFKNFKPTFLESQFDKKFPKKPQRIFVGSMSEIYYWNEEWIEKVIEKVKQYPQHTFMFLTKHPEVYINWKWPKNCWLGITVTKEKDLKPVDPVYICGDDNIIFLCIEPLLDKLTPELRYCDRFDWIILGAESGNRKNKVLPKRIWIESILLHCRRHDIPVYIKDNLSKYYDEYRGYQQFPTIKKL